MAEHVLVTGANGRIGLALVRALVEAGEPVVGLSRSPEGAEKVRALGAECRVGALADRETVRQAADGARVIFHLAGALRGPGPEESADRVNRQGMEELLAALAEADTRALRALVFTSTCAVYGHRPEFPVAETIPALPNTAYGRSKAQAEALLLAASRLPARIVRLAAVYGPDMPILLLEPIRRGTAFLPGDGKNHLPLVHLDDAVRGLRLVAERGRDQAIYNLADPTPLRMGEVYAEIARRVGGRPPRYWSAWLPGPLDIGIAALNERLAEARGKKPRLSPDSIRLFQNDLRMRVQRIESELGMRWAWPDARQGLAALLGPGG